MPTKAVESRRNSDFSGRSSERWSSDIPAFIRAQPGINRRASDASVRSSRNGVENDKLSDIKSESDSDQPDYSAANEKAALMNGKQEEVVTKTRKKNLSWKNDKVKDDQEDITAETSLLPEVQQTTAATAAGGVTVSLVLQFYNFIKTTINAFTKLYFQPQNNYVSFSLEYSWSWKVLKNQHLFYSKYEVSLRFYLKIMQFLILLALFNCF